MVQYTGSENLHTRQDAIDEVNKWFDTFLGAQKNDDPEVTVEAGNNVISLINGIIHDVRQVNKKVIIPGPKGLVTKH